jgi:hypothetical protein
MGALGAEEVCTKFTSVTIGVPSAVAVYTAALASSKVGYSSWMALHEQLLPVCCFMCNSCSMCCGGFSSANQQAGDTFVVTMQSVCITLALGAGPQLQRVFHRQKLWQASAGIA